MRICPIANTVLPITLPASSARTGTAEISSSTTRVCFSSTTDWAIVAPKVCAEMKKIAPNPIATM